MLIASYDLLTFSADRNRYAGVPADRLDPRRLSIQGRLLLYLRSDAYRDNGIYSHKDLCGLHIPGLLAGRGAIQAGLGAFIQVKGVKKGAFCLIAPYVI